MTLDQQILETIQQIGGIFQKKGIVSVPVMLDFLEVEIAPGMEILVVKEMIMYLEELFSEYVKEEKRVHRYYRYLDHFIDTLENNSDGTSLIGHRRTA